jgi:hypothetical protein
MAYNAYVACGMLLAQRSTNNGEGVQNPLQCLDEVLRGHAQMSNWSNIFEQSLFRALSMEKDIARSGQG